MPPRPRSWQSASGKVSSGEASITWPEAVDEALCVGWIDGVRRSIDARSYQIRFTPRRPNSHWSAANIARVAALGAEGRMTPAGMAAFARRTEAKSRNASNEQEGMPTLDAAEEARFREHPAAWEFFQAQPAGYRKRELWRLVAAKRPATRARRFEALMAASARRERL